MKNNKDISIVIPSYNDVQNIAILIKRIKLQLPKSKIIIVDDSPSGENAKLKTIIKKKRNIDLISRLKKRGRGSAVIEGFKKALEDKSVNYVFEMDSDLAHDPKEFKRFLKVKDKTIGLIIGSRYLPGGKIINIAPNRTIMSKIINKCLYYWLGMHLSDHTSGFRLYSRKAVEYLTSAKIKSKGFISLSETAYKLFLAGFKIKEVPITWNFRIYGKSNVNLKELLNSLFFVIYMRIISTRKWKLLLSMLMIFILALSLRVYTLNQMGRTWDEPEYIEQGYKLDELLLKGDFTNSYFYTTYDHPPLAKYIYGISAHFDRKGFTVSGQPIFNYDYTYSRFTSAIFGSLSAVLVLLIAWEFLTPFEAIVSAVIFAMLPFFIGLSQLVSTESILMFLFTASVYSFAKLLKKYSLRMILITGILAGLALETKQSNALLFPLFGLIYVAWYFLKGKVFKMHFFNRQFYALILIGLISLATFIVLWPMPYFHLDIIAQINQKIWLVKTSPPVIFWGKLILSPKIYFITLFLLTTPLVILLFGLLGALKIDKLKNWFTIALLIWFIFPFVQSLYPWRVHAVRYIIEIYAPLSIIAAVGINYLLELIKRHDIRTRLLALILTFAYLLIIFFQTKPYFLDYFNILVGGPKGVYENRYFELGWWGQGLGEAGRYLQASARRNSTIALFISPLNSFPPLKGLTIVSINPNTGVYNPKIKYDYVVVNYFHVLREGFDDSGIKRDYKLIHQVKVDGAPLVNIYSKK